VAEFDYQPVACKRPYRVVVLRKNITVERGQLALFDEVRYFFHITNDRQLSAEQVVRQAGQRCNQENLIEQLKNGIRALRARGQHSQRELGLHGHGRSGLEPQALGSAAAAG
jgi:hypothetical protein